MNVKKNMWIGYLQKVVEFSILAPEDVILGVCYLSHIFVLIVLLRRHGRIINI